MVYKLYGLTEKEIKMLRERNKSEMFKVIENKLGGKLC